MKPDASLQFDSTKKTTPKGLCILAMEAWVLLSAWLTLSGWTLSSVGLLNAKGYCVCLLAGGLLAALWIRTLDTAAIAKSCKVSLKRFRRPLPFLFVFMALLSAIGGALYTPANYDALTYRLPRVLHWIAHEGWHWIPTYNRRMNYSGTGFEWLMTPVLIFTHSDRCLFLLNWIPYLLMPSATFRFLRALGVRLKVAWHWMWLLPLGGGFILQSGGIGNDFYAALYLLIAIGFALHANKSGRVEELWISLLAAALLTGSKVANVPLLLPCAIAAWPAAWRLLMRRKVATLCVLIISAAISFLPLAILNKINTGDYSGDPTNVGRMKLSNPVAGLAGNALMITVNNLAPPILPIASKWNAISDRIEAGKFGRTLEKAYPRFSLEHGEMDTEEGCGISIGLSLLFLVSCVFCLFRRSSPTVEKNLISPPAIARWVAVSGWVALGAYMAKVGSESAPRLIAAYYPLCIASVLIPAGNDLLVRRRWWRFGAILAVLIMLSPMILSPLRPLWPARSIMERLAASHPGNKLIERMDAVYTVFSERPFFFAPLRQCIPAGEEAIGFIGNGDDPNVSLWRPYGTAQILDMCPQTEQAILGRYHHLYVVASRAGIFSWYGMELEQWVSQRHAKIITSRKITIKIHRGNPDEWFLIDLEE